MQQFQRTSINSHSHSIEMSALEILSAYLCNSLYFIVWKLIEIFKFIIQFECMFARCGVMLKRCTDREEGRKKEGGRNTALWPKLVSALELMAAVLFSHPSNSHSFTNNQNNGNPYAERAHIECVILLWQSSWFYGCDRHLFRFICCHFDWHVICVCVCIRNNCSNWCNLPNDAVTASATALLLYVCLFVCGYCCRTLLLPSTPQQRKIKNFNHWR